MITPRKIVSELTSIWTTSLVSYYQYGFVILTSTQGRIANREQQMLVIDLEDIATVRYSTSRIIYLLLITIFMFTVREDNGRTRDQNPKQCTTICRPV